MEDRVGLEPTVSVVAVKCLVDPPGLEPGTSNLKGLYSNQLS